MLKPMALAVSEPLTFVIILGKSLAPTPLTGHSVRPTLVTLRKVTSLKSFIF